MGTPHLCLNPFYVRKNHGITTPNFPCSYHQLHFQRVFYLLPFSPALEINEHLPIEQPCSVPYQVLRGLLPLQIQGGEAGLTNCELPGTSESPLSALLLRVRGGVWPDPTRFAGAADLSLSLLQPGGGGGRETSPDPTAPRLLRSFLSLPVGGASKRPRGAAAPGGGTGRQPGPVARPGR